MTAEWYQLSHSESQATVTDASSYALLEAEIPEKCVALVEVMIAARKESSGDVKTWRKSVTAKRDDSEDAEIIQGALDIVDPQGTVSAALWSAAVDANGNNIRIKVSGSGAIEWSASIDGRVLEVT